MQFYLCVDTCDHYLSQAIERLCHHSRLSGTLAQQYTTDSQYSDPYHQRLKSHNMEIQRPGL